jgi:hypothetical protein
MSLTLDHDVGLCRVNLPVTLVLGEESGRTTSSTGRCSSPEDIIRLVLPFGLHIIYILDNLVDGVPSVGISLGGRKVVMTRNEDIRVSDTLGRGEHRVQSSNRSPVGEEMTLVVMCPGVGAEIVRIVDCGGECEFVGGGVRDDTSICETGDGDLTFFQLRTQRAE